MQILFRFLAYVVSVAVSNKYAVGYWVVGPVFGTAVVVFAWKKAKSNWPGAAAYIAASTLIYALVYRVSSLRWGNDSSELTEYFAGPFPVAVLMGSVLLPCAHAIILGRPRALAWRTAAALAASFYLLTLLRYLNQELEMGPHVSWMPVTVGVWQGVYLVSFFIVSAGENKAGHSRE